MSYEIKIEDYVYTKIAKFVRMNIAYKFNATDCIVYVEFVDKDGIVISNTNVYISEEEYQMWTNNDDYIINLVLSKLGLSRFSEVI